MRSINQTKKKTNKPLVIVLASVLGVALLGGYSFAAYQNAWWPFQGLQTDTSEFNVVNEKENATDPTYTSEKTKDGDETPSSSTDPDSPTSSPTAKTVVQVGISSASREGNYLEVRGFAAGAIEGDGTCTAKATHDGMTITGTSKAFIDASTTQCEPIQISLDKLHAGTWSVVVTYSSATHEGTSGALEVTL